MSKSATDMGFSLIELLVVLSIMALLAVLLIPQLSRRPAGVREHGVVQAIDDVRKAQRAAVAQGQAVTPHIAGANWSADFPQSSRAPQFFADGSAHGGTLRLRNGALLHIDWIDGHVRAAR